MKSFGPARLIALLTAVTALVAAAGCSASGAGTPTPTTPRTTEPASVTQTVTVTITQPATATTPGSTVGDTSGTGASPVEPSTGTPAPIAISLAGMPATVLGLQRDDLAQQAMGNSQAKANGKRLAAVYTAAIPAYRAAYGGPGIAVGYGLVEGKQSAQLLVVNGMVPAPLITSDAEIELTAAVATPSDFIRAPGSATTQCAAQPAQSVVLKDTTAAAVAAARQSVLASNQSTVTCVRSDYRRDVSIRLSVSPMSDTTGPTAAARSRAMAAEVDRIWASMVG